MKSMLPLLKVVMEESTAMSGIDTSLDFNSVKTRYEQEGEEFLTITLPSFGKDLYRALADEKVTPSLFRSFGRKKGEALPRFLGGYLSRLFDIHSGDMLDVGSMVGDVPTIIRCMVQISGLYGKLHEQASPKRTDLAMHRYIENDARVGSVTSVKRNESLKTLGYSDRDLRRTLWRYFGDFLNDLNKNIEKGNIMPSHGPGAVAQKELRGNAKWLQPAWSEDLENVFPFSRWAFNSYLSYLDLLDNDQVADPGPDIPVKVISVPKTQKTPRIIAIEPAGMQYMQQAVRSAFEEALERHPAAFKLIGYTDQTPNQRLAKEGSITKELATLDLSDASDLVSNELVRTLFLEWPSLLEAIQATRSKTALVNLGSGSKVIRLNKFASMGSALCFPIEALVFATIVLTGVHYEPISHDRRSPKTTPVVRVYGDDIIVPADHAQLSAQLLEACGLKVNYDKSFWTGRFRESCGKEYWYGHDVTYVKVRFQLPALNKPLKHDVDATVHTVALRNNLWNQGWFQTVAYLDDILDERLHGVYPVIHPTSSALGRHSWVDYTVDSTSSSLHIPMVRAYVVKSDPPSSILGDYGALMKCLAKKSGLPNPDPRHLLRGGRPAALRLQLRTVPVF